MKHGFLTRPEINQWRYAILTSNSKLTLSCIAILMLSWNPQRNKKCNRQWDKPEEIRLLWAGHPLASPQSSGVSQFIRDWHVFVWQIGRGINKLEGVCRKEGKKRTCLCMSNLCAVCSPICSKGWIFILALQIWNKKFKWEVSCTILYACSPLTIWIIVLSIVVKVRMT